MITGIAITAGAAVLLLLCAAVAAALVVSAVRRPVVDWDAAAELGLARRDGVYVGTVDRWAVRVEPVPVTGGFLDLRVQVDAVGAGVTVTPKGALHGRHAPEPTGDPAFDGRFDVHGPLPTTFEVLRAENRRRLREEPGFSSLRNGRLAVVCRLRATDRRGQLDALPAVVGLAAELTPKAPPTPARLGDLVALEPVAAVRRRMLQWASGHDTPGVADALAEGLLADADPELRYRAALHLGRWAVLLDLAADSRVPPGVRERALAAGAVGGARDDATRAIRSLLACPDGMARRHALERAIHLRLTEIEADAVRALDDRDGEVRLVAVAYLGALGSVDAVAALRAFQTARGDAVSVAAAREAIDAIRARIGVDVGAVSLAAATAGALSVPVASGGLSLATPEKSG